MEAIGVGLIIAWLAGVVSGHTLGSFVYVLLVIGVGLLVARLLGASNIV